MTRFTGLESLLAHGCVAEAYLQAERPLRAYLVRLLRALGLPLSWADDALHDTFVRVLRRRHAYSPWLAAAMTWLRLLARQSLIDIARRERRRRALPLNGPDGRLLHEPEAAGPPADEAQAEALVEAALAPCGPVHREAIRLRLEGVPQKDVARKLGLRPGNVAVVFHHFRARLKAALEE